MIINKIITCKTSDQRPQRWLIDRAFASHTGYRGSIPSRDRPKSLTDTLFFSHMDKVINKSEICAFQPHLKFYRRK